ncbi:putative aminotransferase [Fusarium oxysporum f. sp. narcissi]|uniref:Putative aminotransferase n=1 Tax=Fusarium oxysporum f. sp. narcissi TaxID=451672 RepID=A0A4Q2VIF5_FUSOX|nr:hypothetical protein FOWG_16308 [Fusarium oxysporum f. sp. lycopersici MN25]RYC86299.1 putative aminotransferase [Fusarium oxysporum f. sp. narcissi]
MAPSTIEDFAEVSTYQSSMPVKPMHQEGYLMHRSLVQHPYMVESASGVELKLSSGQTIIDGCAGAAVALIGHGNEEVIQAITDQARKVSYVHTQSYTTAPAEELANVILEGNPYGLEKAFFVGSGSEAVESALKLARQYHYEKGELDRVHIVSRRQCYHGNTMATMSISTNKARRAPYHGFLYPHVSHVSPAFAYHYKDDSETEEQFTARLLVELEEEFLRVGPKNVAAFIAETVVGATTGCVAAPVGYFKGVRAICDKYGVIMILDEIMCGVGRTGTFFAFEQEGVVPDITTIAKGLGGGYAAIAGVLIHKKVVDVLRHGSAAFNHGHTYQAHPISCAAALAVQTVLRRENLVERCHKMGLVLERLLRHELKVCKSVGDIRGRGLFWGVEFIKDLTSKRPFDPSAKFGLLVQQIAFEKGVALYPGGATIDGVNGDHILLAPPFTITEDQLATICRVLKEAVLEAETMMLSP